MSVKNKYNLLYFFYFLACCCLAGFVAVFLQYKGVSNTSIGIVTGGGCVASIFLAPALSSYISKSKYLTIKSAYYIIQIFLVTLFCFLSFLPLPVTLVMIAYMIVYTLYFSSAPFMQALASELTASGEEVNFGLGRGLGSLAWAINALLFGVLVDKFSPRVLAIGYLFFSILFLIVLGTLPAPKQNYSSEKGNKGGNVGTILTKYRIFFLMLLGFSFMMAAATSLGTFFINIVTNLGGDTSFFGFATFVMALSEMPVMAITPNLMKRFRSVDLIVIGGVCYVIRNFIMCLAPNLFILSLGFVFQGLSYGLLTAVITYYVIFNLKMADQTMGQTLVAVMTGGFGSTIGNILGGYLQDAFGLNAMFMFVYILTIAGILVIVYGYFLSRKEKYKNEVIR